MNGSSRLDGKVILVTGAGGGIGRDIALTVAAQGARVVVNDLGASLGGQQTGGNPAQAVADEIRATGGEAVANTGSVADPDGAGGMVEQALDTWGRIDGIVNNAGILRDGFFHKMTFEDFDAVIRVHLYGTFNVSRAAAPRFKDQGSGAFVHMTSTSGLIGNLAQANYSAAKLGIAALSKSIALDMQRFNVRSNCIAPFAWSRMTSSIKVDTPEQEARVRKLMEMKGEKVAVLASFLLSDAAAAVNGQIFAARNNEIFLMGQSRPLRSVHRGEGWTPETIAQHGMPALSGTFYPLNVSADIFSWDPV